MEITIEELETSWGYAEVTGEIETEPGTPAYLYETRAYGLQMEPGEAGELGRFTTNTVKLFDHDGEPLDRPLEATDRIELNILINAWIAKHEDSLLERIMSE